VLGIKKYIGFENVAAFEIGNEIDLFYENGIRKPDYTFDDYLQEFPIYVDAISKISGVSSKFVQGFLPSLLL
jgi:hypothetical protein